MSVSKCHKCHTTQHPWTGEPGGEYSCRLCGSQDLAFITNQHTLCLACDYCSDDPIGWLGAYWLGMLGFALAAPAAIERCANHWHCQCKDLREWDNADGEWCNPCQ